ncbi:kinase-like protein [Clavulina sp. PMI_390]|nr:kinase-like protein [Clavulina sp. PMI_390]
MSDLNSVLVRRIARQQTILAALITLFDSIINIASFNRLHPSNTLSRWQQDFNKAKQLDLTELDELLLRVASDPSNILQTQSLSQQESDDLRGFVLSSMDRLPRESDTDEQLEKAFRSLTISRSTSIVDMTGQLRLLGDSPLVQGSIADFWLAGSSAGSLYAVKIPRNFFDDDVPLLMREARIATQLAHPNVLPAYGIATFGEARPPGLVLPHMKNGNVIEYLVKNPETDRLQICFDVAQGLQYIHSRNLVHGNIGVLSTLITDRGTAVVSGFLFSHRSQDPLLTPGARSGLDWSDIEELPSSLVYRESSKSVDIDSFGVLMHELLILMDKRTRSRRPWRVRTDRALQASSKLPPKELLPDALPNIRQGVWDIMRECTPGDNDESQLTMDTVVEKLSHYQSARRHRGDSDDHIPSSVMEERGSPLVDLSAEIRRIDQLPIMGGGFCDIYRGERLGKQQVALKILKTFGAPEQLRRRFLAEARIWAELRHPNILEFQGICDHGTSISMVSPWLPNGNIIHYLASVAPTANRYKLLYDASQGLLYLHSLPSRIVHGDIKSANILVQNDGTACLGDFGLSRLHEEVTASSLRDMGSQRYMAPELFEGWENDSLPMKNMETDCYAMGQVVLELASGMRPFAEIPNEHIIYSAVSRGYRPKRPESDVAKVWLTDRVWKLVQSKQPSRSSAKPPRR